MTALRRNQPEPSIHEPHPLPFRMGSQRLRRGGSGVGVSVAVAEEPKGNVTPAPGRRDLQGPCAIRHLDTHR